MKRTFSVPPALWWRQSQAATLEARRLSPSPPDETTIRIRRISLWRPDRAAQFEATYARDGTPSVLPPAASRVTMVLVGAAAIAVIIATSSTIIKRDAVAPTAPQSRPGEPAAIAITQHALVAAMIADLSDIGRRTTGADIKRLVWTPNQIAIETDPASVVKLRQALAGSEQAPKIAVSAQGKGQ